MRYSTTIDNRTYAIELKSYELFILDRVARELATMAAQKFYGKRKGKAIFIDEVRGGRGIEPHRRYWTFDATIAKLGQLDEAIERQFVTFQINESQSKPPRTPSPKKSRPIEPKLLTEILGDI